MDSVFFFFFFSLPVAFNLCKPSGSLVIPLLPGCLSWYSQCNLMLMCFYWGKQILAEWSTLAVFSQVLWIEGDKLFVKMCHVCRPPSCGSLASFLEHYEKQQMCFYFGLSANPAHATASGCSGRKWLMPLNIQYVSFGSEISTHMSCVM